MERIEVRIPADKRLARVVRAAVSIVARGVGIPPGRATAFAGEVARRFNGLAVRGRESTEPVALTLEAAAAGLDVKIGRGGRHTAILKVRNGRKRPGSSRRPDTGRRASARRR